VLTTLAHAALMKTALFQLRKKKTTHVKYMPGAQNLLFAALFIFSFTPVVTASARV
jgi:hypothetical protein